MSCFLLHPIRMEKELIQAATDVLSNRFGTVQSAKDLPLEGLNYQQSQEPIIRAIKESQVVCLLEDRGFIGQGTHFFAVRAMKFGRPVYVARQRFLGPLPWGWDILLVTRMTIVDEHNWQLYAVVEV